MFWGLVPFLIPQALYVRRVATRLDPATGPNSGAMGDGEPFRLLAVGDSIIAGVGATNYPSSITGQTAAALANVLGRRVSWEAHGLNGAKTATVLEDMLPRAVPRPADAILVSVGVNDVTKLTSVSRWSRDLQDLVAALRRHSPAALIVMIGLPPMGHFPALPQPLRALIGMRARHFDEVLRDIVAASNQLIHIPLHFVPDPEQFCADGYHPSELGYRQLGREIADRIAGSDRHIGGSTPGGQVTVNSMSSSSLSSKP